MTDRAVLSVDFELFSQTPAYRGAAGETEREDAGLGANEFLCSALDEHGAAATFFVVSSVAERHPGVVRALSEAGHEVASHTHSHRLLSSLSDAERLDELRRSRRVLERVTGRTVSGFRAPAFDLPPGHFDDLAAAGYRYDSSVVPSRSVPGWYGGDHDVHRPCGATRIQPGATADVAELPVSVMPGLRLPLTGAWLRFFGPRYTITGMNWLARRGITPVLYVHPWEFVGLPDVEGVPRRVYWRTGAWMRRAVERILAQPFEFVTARTVVEDAGDDDVRYATRKNAVGVGSNEDDGAVAEPAGGRGLVGAVPGDDPEDGGRRGDDAPGDG